MLGVTSSPVRPSPRVAPRTQHAVLVDQVDGEPVDLQLAQVVDRAAGVALGPRRPGGQLVDEKTLSRLSSRSRWSTGVNCVE